MRPLFRGLIGLMLCAAAPWAQAHPNAPDSESVGSPMRPIEPATAGAVDDLADTSAALPPAQLARDTLNFAVALYDLLAREPGNVVFSPFDIARAMGLLYSGSQSATLAEIRKVMQWKIESEDLPGAFAELEQDLTGSQGLHLHTALFAAPKLNLPDAYHPDVIDRKANISKWVKDDTNQHFDLSEALRQPVATILSVTLLDSKLGEGKNRNLAKRHYRARSGEMLNLRTMTNDSRLRYFETPEFKMVELKYAGDRFGLIIFLPRDDSISLKTSPTADILHDMIAQLAPTRVQVALPVFAMTSTFRLRKPLNELGLAVALGQNADFSQWGSGAKGLMVRDIIHKATIDVDDRTTAAAAATSIKLQGTETKLKATKPGKILDKPFLFMVRDTTWGVPLLYGRVEAAL